MIEETPIVEIAAVIFMASCSFFTKKWVETGVACLMCWLVWFGYYFVGVIRFWAQWHLVLLSIETILEGSQIGIPNKK